MDAAEVEAQALHNERMAERRELRSLRAVLEKWRPVIERATDWYLRQGDVPRAKAFAAMLSDFDEALGHSKVG